MAQSDMNQALLFTPCVSFQNRSRTSCRCHRKIKVWKMLTKYNKFTGCKDVKNMCHFMSFHVICWNHEAPEHMERSLQRLLQMVAYCEENYTCRRAFIINYFDEQKSTLTKCQPPGAICDICRMASKGLCQVDVIYEAQLAVQLLRSARQLVRGKGVAPLTLHSVKDALLGSKAQKMSSWQSLPGFGSLREGWTEAEVLRLLRRLIVKSILAEEITTPGGAAGCVTVAYLIEGRYSESLLHGEIPIQLCREEMHQKGGVKRKLKSENESNVAVSPDIRNRNRRLSTTQIRKVRQRQREKSNQDQMQPMTQQIESQPMGNMPQHPAHPQYTPPGIAYGHLQQQNFGQPSQHPQQQTQAGATFGHPQQQNFMPFQHQYIAGIPQHQQMMTQPGYQQSQQQTPAGTACGHPQQHNVMPSQHQYIAGIPQHQQMMTQPGYQQSQQQIPAGTACGHPPQHNVMPSQHQYVAGIPQHQQMMTQPGYLQSQQQTHIAGIPQHQQMMTQPGYQQSQQQTPAGTACGQPQQHNVMPCQQQHIAGIPQHQQVMTQPGYLQSQQQTPDGTACGQPQQHNVMPCQQQHIAGIPQHQQMMTQPGYQQSQQQTPDGTACGQPQQHNVMLCQQQHIAGIPQHQQMMTQPGYQQSQQQTPDGTACGQPQQHNIMPCQQQHIAGIPQHQQMMTQGYQQSQQQTPAGTACGQPQQHNVMPCQQQHMADIPQHQQMMTQPGYQPSQQQTPDGTACGQPQQHNVMPCQQQHMADIPQHQQMMTQPGYQQSQQQTPAGTACGQPQQHNVMPCQQQHMADIPQHQQMMTQPGYQQSQQQTPAGTACGQSQQHNFSEQQFPENQGQFRASHGINTNTTSTWSTGAGIDESRMKWPCSLEAEDIWKEPKCWQNVEKLELQRYSWQYLDIPCSSGIHVDRFSTGQTRFPRSSWYFMRIEQWHQLQGYLMAGQLGDSWWPEKMTRRSWQETVGGRWKLNRASKF